MSLKSKISKHGKKTNIKYPITLGNKIKYNKNLKRRFYKAYAWNLSQTYGCSPLPEKVF